MNTHTKFEAPTQAEIEKIIHQANRMRSEYLAHLMKTGLSNLRGVFENKKPVGNARA